VARGDDLQEALMDCRSADAPVAHLLVKGRPSALLVGIAVLGAMSWPMFRDPPTDSFPLSTYPMFSRHRPTVVALDHVVGVRTDGRREVIPPGTVASREVLQTKVLIRDTVRRGRKATMQLCRQVATRVSASEFEKVEIRHDAYRVLPYFDGDRKPVKSRVHARCAVGGKP
jgi:hypothetical protein